MIEIVAVDVYFAALPSSNSLAFFIFLSNFLLFLFFPLLNLFLRHIIRVFLNWFFRSPHLLLLSWINDFSPECGISDTFYLVIVVPELLSSYPFLIIKGQEYLHGAWVFNVIKFILWDLSPVKQPREGRYNALQAFQFALPGCTNHALIRLAWGVCCCWVVLCEELYSLNWRII